MLPLLVQQERKGRTKPIAQVTSENSLLATCTPAYVSIRQHTSAAGENSLVKTRYLHTMRVDWELKQLKQLSSLWKQLRQGSL